MEGELEYFSKHHTQHEIGANQCSSSLTKRIKAPTDIVWSLVRRFDQPQRYKPFISECNLTGDFKVGIVREVNVRSGLPATKSTERLELLDDEQRILGVRITGGDHRLKNYSSVITVHPETIDGRPGTLLIESFVVDVPDGNTIEDTCCFIEALTIVTSTALLMSLRRLHQATTRKKTKTKTKTTVLKLNLFNSSF